MERTVVIGAGHAGVQVADSLRTGGYGGSVVVLGDEIDHPYQRPPLSKDFVAEENEPAALPLRAERYFTDSRIDLRLATAARAIDRERHLVRLSDGQQLSYTTLVIATGALPRSLEMAGCDATGVTDLRTLADAKSLRKALTAARSVVVVGAGFIGLEFAAAARKRGIEVTVLEVAQRPLERAVSAETARYLTDAHRRMGTVLRTGEGLAALETRDGAVRAAVGGSGRRYPADLVLLGVGVRPRAELALRAGLPVDDGIVVDEHLRTCDPAIYAIGDCARFPAGGGASHRLESVQNATDQARHVASTILGSTVARYCALPRFWSNQGAVRLQIAGLTRPGDTTETRGDVAGGRFSVHCFRGGRLVAVESVNRPADHMAARRVLSHTSHLS